MRRNDLRARTHASWLAFAVHRVSGLLLLAFLPVHFWTLGLALQGEAALDGALRWYEAPIFKFGEWALVLCLSVHLAGGLRLLWIEFAPWGGLRRGWIAVGTAASLAVSLLFVANMLG
ncbi:MAG TPA: succinate dehydrogenase [Bordetella sp.]|nr:succinate dehydrogenase [Bordetella sp.]